MFLSMGVAGVAAYLAVTRAPYYIVVALTCMALFTWTQRGPASYRRHRRRVILALRLLRLVGVLSAYARLRSGGDLFGVGGSGSSPTIYVLKRVFLLSNSATNLYLSCSFLLDGHLQVPLVLLFAALGLLVGTPVACQSLNQPPYSGVVSSLHARLTRLAVFPHVAAAQQVHADMCSPPSGCCQQLVVGVQLFFGALVPLYQHMVVEMHYWRLWAEVLAGGGRQGGPQQLQQAPRGSPQRWRWPVQPPRAAPDGVFAAKGPRLAHMLGGWMLHATVLALMAITTWNCVLAGHLVLARGHAVGGITCS